MGLPLCSYNSVSDLTCCWAAGLCCLIDFLPSRINTPVVLFGRQLKFINPVFHRNSKRPILTGQIGKEQGSGGHLKVRAASIFFQNLA